jgi:hypothetical protein
MGLEDSKKWYDKTWLVVLLCIVVFPVGLFALWKNASISNGWKIGVSVFFALVIIANFGNSKDAGVIDIKAEKEKQLTNIAFESETALKKSLKDPESYENVSKDWQFLNDSVYEINIVYSATNSFGGRIQNKYLKTGILAFNKKDTIFTNTVKFEKSY